MFDFDENATENNIIIAFAFPESKTCALKSNKISYRIGDRLQRFSHSRDGPKYDKTATARNKNCRFARFNFTDLIPLSNHVKKYLKKSNLVLKNQIPSVRFKGAVCYVNVLCKSKRSRSILKWFFPV